MAARQATTARANEPVAAALRRALRLAGAGRLEEAAGVYRDVLGRDGDVVEALVNLGAILCRTGSPAEAVGLLRRAVELAPSHRQARTNLFAACEMESNARRAAGDHAGAAVSLREMLALDPGCTAARVNLIDCLFRANRPGRIEDFAPAAAPRGTSILIACMPKSGSSWLLNALRTLTGFPHAAFVFGFLQNEQDLYLPEVAAAAAENSVTQQHCRATAANVQIMQAFAIRPVVLVRNPFDALISLAAYYPSLDFGRIGL